MLKTARHRPVVIALCGKGGVGKTSLSATIVKLLSANPANRVLAIDADPAVGLATALGVRAGKTVDDIRNDLIRRVASGQTVDKAGLIADLDYEMASALAESGNIAFLAIGRPETDGCYCQVNHVLKDLIAGMAENFDFVVIDGEAGIEQVNRRVMERVTHLMLVSDASVKGLNVAATIQQVSKGMMKYEKAGLIVNRLKSPKERDLLRLPPELHCLGWVPEDDAVRACDMEGRSILEMADFPALAAINTCLEAMFRPSPPFAP